MLAPHLVRKFSGLYGSVNPLEAPEGAADVADNCVVRSADLLEARRGYSSFSSTLQRDAIAFKQSKLVALARDPSGYPSDTGESSGQLGYYDFSLQSWTQLSMNPGGLPFTQPGLRAGVGTRFVAANKALYFQSRYGLTKIEDLTTSSTCRPAVQPPMNIASPAAAGGVSYAVGTGAVNWLANNFQTAYRFTVCRKGANSELIESEPSDRLIASNTSGAAVYVQLTISFGWMTARDAFVRVYRSKAQAATGTDPTDEMYLVAEVAVPAGASLGAGNYARTSVNYSDLTPDTSLYVPLYSNLQSGSAPGRPFTSAPLASDMFYFKNRMYYLNTADVHRIVLKVIGTGSGGIQGGDWITINGMRFVFGSGGTVGYFPQAYTSGTAAQNIENTARDLAAVINNYFNAQPVTGVGAVGLANIVLARYISGTGTDAGQVELQALLPGTSAITVQTSSRNGWGSDYTTATSSDSNTQTAGLSWSEQSQPEAVPLSNATIVGDASDESLRGVALRDAGFIFKRREGVWKVTDDGSVLGPVLTLFDSTVRLVAPETLVSVDNVAVGLSDQGVIALNETGKVNIAEDQTEREMFALMAYVGRDTLAKVAFAVAYDREHQYILCLPENPTATSCTLQYVYNLKTRAWTRWTLPGVVAGAVDPDSGQLTWTFASSAQVTGYQSTVWRERKNGDSSDAQDPSITVACPTSAATATLVFSGDRRAGTSSTPIDVGDVVQQAQATYFLRQRVTAIVYSSSANQTTVTLDAAPAHAWDGGTNLTVVKAIKSVVRFLPFRADSQGGALVDKTWTTAYLAFRYLDADTFSVGWSTEKAQPASASASSIATFLSAEQITGDSGSFALSTWAPSSWGSGFWGRQTRGVTLRVSLPDVATPSAQLTLALVFQQALTRWELSAVDVKLQAVSDAAVR